MSAEAKGGEDAPPKPAGKKISPQVIVGALNVLVALGALGFFAYTKLIYQKPAIVEEVEIEKKKEEIKATPSPEEPAFVNFDPITVNLAMSGGKPHYVTLALTLEARDGDVLNTIKVKKALFLDKMIGTLGKKQMSEVNSIRGKLLLKTELMRAFNEIEGSGAGITDLYFATFMVQ